MINGEEERQKIVISNLRLVSKQGWQMNKWQSSRCMQSIAKKLHLIAMVLQWQWKKKGNWKKLNRNKIRSTTFCNFVCGKGWSRKDQKICSVANLPSLNSTGVKMKTSITALQKSFQDYQSHIIKSSYTVISLNKQNLSTTILTK